jgi:hypothetical protein
MNRIAYIKKIKGKYHVKSHKNPDWSGGIYDTKQEAIARLHKIEMFKHIKKNKKKHKASIIEIAMRIAGFI